MTSSIGSPESLAERVALVQALSGLDKANLSRLAGLTPSHVGMLISGHVKRPAATTLGALARVLGVSFEWLVSGTGTAPKPATVRRAVGRAVANQPRVAA